MIIFIATQLARFFPNRTENMRDARRIFLLLCLLGLILLIALLSSFCRKGNEPKIDTQAVERINSENEMVRKAELERVITNNSDVVKTVDNRNVLTSVTVEERNKQIRAKVVVAEKAVQEAKKQGRDITGPELDCLLIQKCEGK